MGDMDQHNPGFENDDDIRPIETSPGEPGKPEEPADSPLPSSAQFQQSFTEPPPPPEPEIPDEIKSHMVDEEANLVKRGDYIDLLESHPALRQINVAVGWEQKAFEDEKVDVDISCFLLNRDDMTRKNEDFVFYNNMTGCDGSVKLKEDSRTGAGEGDDETIFLDLNGIPFDILKVVFVLSIYDPELKVSGLDAVRDVYLRLVDVDDDLEILRYIPTEEDLAQQHAVILACLVREGPKWHLEPQAAPIEGGLATIAQQYGMLIAESTG